MKPGRTFEEISRQIKGLGRIDVEALKRSGVKDPLAVKALLERISRLGDLDSPQKVMDALGQEKVRRAVEGLFGRLPELRGRSGYARRAESEGGGESSNGSGSPTRSSEAGAIEVTEGTPRPQVSPIIKPGRFGLLPADNTRASAFSMEKVTPGFAYGVKAFESGEGLTRQARMTDEEWKAAQRAYFTAKERQGGIVTTALDLSRIERLPWYPKVQASLEEFDRLWGITIPYFKPLKVVHLEGSKDTGGYLPGHGVGMHIALSGKDVEHTVSHELGHWILHEMLGVPTPNQEPKLTVADIWDEEVQAIIKEAQNTGDSRQGGRALRAGAQSKRPDAFILYLAHPHEIFARVFERATNHLVGRNQRGYGMHYDFTIFTNSEMERIIPYVRRLLKRFQRATEQSK